MKDSTSIREAYWEAEKHFVNLIDIAATQKNDQEYLRLLVLSKTNENAYFVLFWGQFEAFINDKVTDIESSAMEMGLMSRVMLAISPKHEYYNEIDKYYTWRCKLAHGEVAKFQSLILASVFDKIDEIIEAIENSPLPLGDDFYDLFPENAA